MFLSKRHAILLDLKDREIIQGFLDGRKPEHAILVQWIKEIARVRLHTKRVSSDEIVSDTMYKLLNAFRSESFRLAGSLKAYVQAVSWYTIIDHVRYWRRHADLPETFDPPDPTDVSAEIEKKEDEVMMERIFGLMSGECRRLWNLRFVDDLDYGEIAVRLGISPENVKVRFHRCKKQAIAIRERIS